MSALLTPAEDDGSTELFVAPLARYVTMESTIDAIEVGHRTSRPLLSSIQGLRVLLLFDQVTNDTNAQSPILVEVSHASLDC